MIRKRRDEPAGPRAIRAKLASLGPPPGEVTAGEQPPMLATPGRAPFSAAGWLFEIKYDGVRVRAARRGEEVTLLGRSGQNVTARYPEIVRALRALPLPHFLIDGEIVALDEGGRPSFQRLQARMALTEPREVERAAARVPATAVFFDCLGLDGFDLRRLPLAERKECLRLLLPTRGVIRYGDHVLGEGEAFYAAASEARLEGILAKRADSRYTAGRSRDWIKLKCHLRQDFVVGGYTDPQGTRAFFGALHLGLYAADASGRPRLVYVSKVGSGFDDAVLRRAWESLQRWGRPTSPFVTKSPVGRGHHWVEPRLVCEVRFTGWTDDGGIRHPIFLGLRPEARPEDCRSRAQSRRSGSRRSVT